ncbi:hypothetical protein ITP53_48710 [Nonomuraea sp. K274]|uniref:SAF domain-containing protein n=1 Tax=Nonomuraea cypriaca TaxID=1187855 RepID=A0A931F2Z5_9ACTN|nr:hypothetical protein [Nonomuraea cypriaca]MBF8193429.1 hypothetical protein [Nonomuraea cypriaca]
MRTSEKPAANAAAGLSGPASRKLPVPPRERKPALAALAVLLILGGALATTLLVLRSGDRVSAIRISQQVGAGQKFTTQALEEVKIAAESGVDFVSWSQRGQVLDSFAAVTILPGTLLTNNMGVRASSELGEGKATVGLSLKPGQIPAGIAEGDRVQVVHVPSRSSQAQSRVLAASALVFATGDRSRNGNSGQITVVVDSAAAPEIMVFASSGEIAVAELPGAR